MARIKIKDIPVERELSDDDLGGVSGGLTSLYSTTTLQSSTQLYGSYSIQKMPLPGVTVAGVRG